MYKKETEEPVKTRRSLASKQTALEKNEVKEEVTSRDSKLQPMGDGDSLDTNDTMNERRRRRKGKSSKHAEGKYGDVEIDEDLEKMLKWKNGVGHLPGSNLRFRKSDMGQLEVVNGSDEDEEDSKSKKGRRSEFSSPCGSPSVVKKAEQEEGAVGEDLTPNVKKQINKRYRKKKKFGDDELLRCETCGCYGLISEFRSSGRFCSQRCVGAYASKCRAEMFIKDGEQVPVKQLKRQSTGDKKKIARKRKSELKGTPSSTSHSSNKIKKNQPLKQINDDSTVYYKEVKNKSEFDWNTYLKITKTEMVPTDFFYKEYAEQELFPTNAGQFEDGMKLECVDPKHQSLFCVCTVVEVQGARMRLNFDGWSPNYDFWINTNSFFLHPCGWCERNSQTLQPPRGEKNFNWDSYLAKTESKAAPENLFYEPTPMGRHGFRTCMKLEAVDRKNPDLICVASVNNVMGDQFLVHFDEWDDQYDYWSKDDSPYIHPMGWCQKNGVHLVPPTDDMVGKFVWKDYLTDTTCIAAPEEIFKKKPKPPFQIGQKLEVIDPRNPSLCRVATIKGNDEYRIKAHFDGWDDIYDYWFDMDSIDIHPVGWCERTGHKLDPPPSPFDSDSQCGTYGCHGVGHIKGAKYTTHHTSFGCPYTLHNLNRTTSPVIDRLAVNDQPKSPREEMLPDSTTKIDGTKQVNTKVRAKKKLINLSARKRKRRGSDEVSSSTNLPSESKTIVSIERKKISSTRVPAGKTNGYSSEVYRSRAIPWSTDDVAEFLKSIGYEEHIPSFKDHQIDGQALLLLSQADLVRHLKLKLGPALKIYSEISKL